MKPFIHAKRSAKKWGGRPEDYLEIHNFMDSSKALIADNRHRAIFHSSFGIFILEKVFGTNITNSEGKLVSVRDLGEQHCLEDFGGKFIPSAQDYLAEIEIKPWMSNLGGMPPSAKKLRIRKDND